MAPRNKHTRFRVPVSNRSSKTSPSSFIHDEETSVEMEALSADVFGRLFRGPNAAPAIDRGLWDKVFDDAFPDPNDAEQAEDARAKLHVVRPMAKRKLGKRIRAAREASTSTDDLSVEDAVAIVKGNVSARFDETVEIAMNLGVDPRHADQMIRGVVSLPHGTGRIVRVAVFARGPKAVEAKEAGADIVGAEDLMQAVLKGKIEFDRCIATPDMMPIVGRLGKVLGPRNLMPSSNVGTVTMEVKAAVEAAKGGEVQFKVEKAGVIHAGIGKVSFDEAKLVENIRAFVDAVVKAKPTSAKGAYMKKVSLSSTMGPGVSVDVHKAGKSGKARIADVSPHRLKGNRP